MRTRNTNNIDLWNIQCKKYNNKKDANYRNSQTILNYRIGSLVTNITIFGQNVVFPFQPTLTVPFSATVSFWPAQFSLKLTIIITLLNLV